MTWGVESHIVERFGQAGVPKENISMVKDTYYFASPDKSPARVHRICFDDFYGPTMNACEAARKNGKEEELHTQLVELANAQNKSGRRHAHSCDVHAGDGFGVAGASSRSAAGRFRSFAGVKKLRPA